jgi:hypothetical protein
MAAGSVITGFISETTGKLSTALRPLSSTSWPKRALKTIFGDSPYLTILLPCFIQKKGVNPAPLVKQKRC